METSDKCFVATKKSAGIALLEYSLYAADACQSVDFNKTED